MIKKPARAAGIILVVLVLLLSTVSVEARTFRKAVSQDVVSDQPSAVSTSKTTNYQPQTAQDLQNCEPTIKRIRGKRVVSSNCQLSAIGYQPKQDNLATGFQTSSTPELKANSQQPIANTIIVLNTNDVAKTKEAVNLIRANGGVVSIVYIPNTLVVLKLPVNVESTLISKYGATISKGGIPNGAAPALINALSAPQITSHQSRTNYEFKEEPLQIAPDVRNRISVPPGSSGYPPGDILGCEGSCLTSGYMVGDVFVSVILPESDGTLDANVEDWNATEETIVDQQITEALNWWVARSQQYSASYTLTFWTYPTHQKINTKYEPTQRPRSDNTLWVNDVFDKMGVAPAGDIWTRTRNYDNTLRNDKKTDWALTLFVVDDSTGTGLWGAYAYGGGPFEVVDYNNVMADFNQNLLGVSIAHETGHIFWADDQYSGGGRVCTDKSGLLQVENQNLNSGCLMNDPNTIMRGGMSTLATTTHDSYGAGQMGWRDLDGDGVTDSIDITYNTWDIDTDGDQTINYWDIDDDNDGINDVNDFCPLSYGWAPAQGCSPVNLTVVSDKSTAQIGEVVRITASGIDNFKVATLEIYIDGINQSGTVCSGIGTPTANCYKDVSYGATGTHTFYALTTDDNNQTRDPVSGTKSFSIIDSGSPTISVTAPASVQVGQNIRITSSATDNVAVSAIDIYVDDVVQAGTTCSGLGTTSANCYKDLTFGSAGTHTYYSVATDSSSNTARDPVSGTKSFNVVANPAPTISVTAPATVQVSTPIRVTAAATDNSQVQTIKIFVDGAEINGLTCSGLGTASANCYKDLTYSTLGVHTFYSTATDDLGSVTRDPVSGTKSFNVVDTTAPTVSVTGPASPVPIGQTITITGTASDNYQLSEITVYVDGALVRTCTGGVTNCDFQTSFAAPGTHNYYAIAKDSSGNSAQATTKTFDVVDNIAPTFTEPITVNAAGSSVTIIAKAADNYQLSEIKIFLDGSLVKTCPTSGTSGQCDYSTSLTYGTHRTYAVATDSSGNTATHPEKIFELKDNIPPNGVLSYAGTSDPAEGKRFVITISGNDDNALSSIAIYRSGAKNPVKACTFGGKSGSCEFRSNWGYESRNSRDYYAVVTDKAGNKVTVR